MTAVQRALSERPSAHRRGMLAKVHIAKVQLGLSDDDYQAVLLREAGHASARDCSDGELHAVLKAFERQGFTAKAKVPVKGPKPADHPVARKARAMWISLYHLGAIDNPTEAALEAFACRQLKVDRLQWANQAQGYKLIEALKAMAGRHGWDQSLEGVAIAAKVIVLKRTLVEAIVAKLVVRGIVAEAWAVERAAYELAGITFDLYTAGTEELDRVAKALGAALRKAGPAA